MLSWKEYTKAVDVWSAGVRAQGRRNRKADASVKVRALAVHRRSLFLPPLCLPLHLLQCILAEILGRKPLFPGRDYMHQLHMVVDVLGTPSHADTEYIASEKAKAYIRSLPFKPRVDFRTLFPKAPPLALDLLEKMLTFAPEKRITVEEALAHPYLQLLHDPTDEPTAPTPFDVDFESVPLSKESLRALLWEEVCLMHPSLRQQTPPGLHIPDIKAEAAIYKQQQAEARRNGQAPTPVPDVMDMS